MGWLRDWVMTICCGAVFCAVINLLVPDERYEKVIKVCTAAFILLLIAAPLANLRSCDIEYVSAEDKVYEQSDFEKSISCQAEKYMASAAEKVMIQYLEENEISNIKIWVSMDSSDNGCISIGHVTVDTDGSQPADKQIIKTLLKNKFGLDDVEVR